jgi:hypothetical protein
MPASGFLLQVGQSPQYIVLLQVCRLKYLITPFNKIYIERYFAFGF